MITLLVTTVGRAYIGWRRKKLYQSDERLVLIWEESRALDNFYAYCWQVALLIDIVFVCQLVLVLVGCRCR